MEKYITDERTGLTYELIGDYYYLAGDDEPEEPLGRWARMRMAYLQETRRLEYHFLQITFKLEPHLRDIDQQAEAMYSQLVKQLKQQECITEHLKATDQMAWVQAMNNIDNRAKEIVCNELIYA